MEILEAILKRFNLKWGNYHLNLQIPLTHYARMAASKADVGFPAACPAKLTGSPSPWWRSQAFCPHHLLELADFACCVWTFQDLNVKISSTTSYLWHGWFIQSMHTHCKVTHNDLAPILTYLWIRQIPIKIFSVKLDYNIIT